MRNVVAGLVLISSLIASDLSAATIRVLTNGIFYDAKNGETNNVLVAGLNFPDNPFGEGFLIIDSANVVITTTDTRCRAQGNQAMCTISPNFVKVFLGDQNDTLTSSAGVRLIVNGGTGTDTITGDNANDDLDGDLGSDTIDGRGGADTIRGGLGGDTLTGGSGVDEIIGSTGVDTINAQDGSVDTIRCGGGKDVLTKDGNDKTRRCND